MKKRINNLMNKAKRRMYRIIDFIYRKKINKEGEEK